MSLPDREKAINEEFEKLANEDKALDEQIRQAQQKRSQIRARQVQLQGQFQLLQELKKEDKKEEPKVAKK